MRRTQDVSVSMAIATNETPLFERAALKRDAPTIYKALFPTLELPFGGFNIRGQVPEDWKAKGNRKWALWDLAKSAQRISPKDKDLASIFPPTVSIHEKNFSLRGEKEIEATGDGKNLYGSVITALTHPVTLTSSEIQTLFSAARALDKEDFRAIKEDYENYEMNQGHLYGTKGEDAMEFITPRVKNLHFDMDIVLSEIHEFNDPHILLSLLNILYGGAHASAWNGHFPTSIERWIWRVSCLVLVLPAIATTTKYITQKLPSKAHMDYYVDRAVHILLHPLLLVYFLARVYIVVESFISVRSLPEGSYQTVEMSAFWPHF